jgi:hypothetical protein
MEKYEKGIDQLTFEELKPKKSDINIKSVELVWKLY